jgi:hypothetical protein
MHPDHWLARLIGFEGASAVSRFYRTISGNDRLNGSWIKVPRATAALRADRWRSILKADLSLNETASIMNVDERTVSRWRARLRNRSRRRLS